MVAGGARPGADRPLPIARNVDVGVTDPLITPTTEKVRNSAVRILLYSTSGAFVTYTTSLGWMPNCCVVKMDVGWLRSNRKTTDFTPGRTCGSTRRNTKTPVLLARSSDRPPTWPSASRSLYPLDRVMS